MALIVQKFLLMALLPVLGFFALADNGVTPPPPSNGPDTPFTAVEPPPQQVLNPHSDKPEARTNLVTAAAIKSCLGQGASSGDCLDGMFREFLKIHTTADALATIQKYEDTDSAIRLSCHPVVHAVGRETFRQQKTIHDSFGVCDQTCHSGCYHGVMERFLRGDEASDGTTGHVSPEELYEKTANACSPDQAFRFRFQCLHGLGHALMFFSDYDLRQSLKTCGATGDSWSKSSCYGGVFMENVFSATPEKRDLKADDVHYPCNDLDTAYQSDCYMMQTTRMSEMGLSTERLFEECRNAGAYIHTCMQSIGRDLSNEARVGNPRSVSQKCEMGEGSEREACTRGVSYALIDNTWDGRYALPFCETYTNASDVSYCYNVSMSYLKGTFERDRTYLLQECQKYVPASQACVSAAER